MDLDELKKLRDELNAKISSEGKAALAKAFTDLFDANPTIRAVGWQQYTPYFNDGEECVFGVNDFVFATEDVDPKKEPQEDNGPWRSTYGRSGSSAEGEAVKGLYRKLNEVDGILKAAFGDHVSVVATREGFHTFEYKHD